MFDGSYANSLFTKQVKNPWEDWWAWHPVTTISGYRVWLKPICRRVKMKYGDQRLHAEWEYGTVFDVLKDTE